MRTWDGSLIPGPIERPEPRTRLQEALEGKQIARVVLDQAPGPTGSPVLGLEFTSGERLAIMAQRDLSRREPGPGATPPYRARLIFRLMGRQKIVTPRMAGLFSRGRAADAGGVPADLPDLERRLEGEVIRGIRHIAEPTGWDCEQIEAELVSGGRLWLAADHQVRDPRYRAELLAQYRRREATSVWMPGLARN